VNDLPDEEMHQKMIDQYNIHSIVIEEDVEESMVKQAIPA